MRRSPSNPSRAEKPPPRWQLAGGKNGLWGCSQFVVFLLRCSQLNSLSISSCSGRFPSILCVEFDELRNPIDNALMGRILRYLDLMEKCGYKFRHIEHSCLVCAIEQQGAFCPKPFEFLRVRVGARWQCEVRGSRCQPGAPRNGSCRI